ncbi:MAG: hypothetical protein WAV16_04285 [Candidatus Moraniibacteriota bacterium]
MGTKTAFGISEEIARKNRINIIEVVGITSIMIALASFVAASVIEIFRGTFSISSDPAALVQNFSPYSYGLLMLWGMAITVLLSCIVLLKLQLKK